MDAHAAPKSCRSATHLPSKARVHTSMQWKRILQCVHMGGCFEVPFGFKGAQGKQPFWEGAPGKKTHVLLFPGNFGLGTNEPQFVGGILEQID